jgi:multidrug efflux pump subunit AcrA (membrane-fusion protein)
MKYLLFAFFLLVAMSCKKKTEVTSPTVVNISESVYASGIVKSKNQYQVYSTVNGLIQEIIVTEGDLVKKGDPLFKILNEPSRLNSSNAKLASDYADLKANADKLKAAKVNSELAHSKLKNDSLLFVRQANLRKQGVGSVVELEQRELAYKNSVTNYEVSLLTYRDLKRQLEFASNQAENNLKISNALAGDYTLKADVDGKVYKILKEKGEFVNTQNPVAILGDASEFILEMKVDEFDIVRLREGQKVLFTMDSYKGQVFEAIVTKIEPLMNEQSRSFTVNAQFISKPAVLYPNLSAEANIVINTKERALTIPRNYLIGDSVVLVNKDERRRVNVGLRDYQKVEILSGLSASEVIYKPNP